MVSINIKLRNGHRYRCYRSVISCIRSL